MITSLKYRGIMRAFAITCDKPMLLVYDFYNGKDLWATIKMIKSNPNLQQVLDDNGFILF